MAIPRLIYKLSYRFKGHDNLHVRGYKEKGNINTPLELATLNETTRFHLVIDVIDRVPKRRTKFDFWHMEREQDR
jgi:xylulose-5-phosphate/fructose-6-phosphate phosphoketolase